MRISALISAALLLACGSSHDPQYTIPVSSELKPYEAPDEEDVLDEAGLADEGDDDDDDDGDEEGDEPPPDSNEPSAEDKTPADESTVDGELPKASIKKSIAQTKRKLAFCYERQLVKDPNLGGKVVLRFVIGGKGTVTKAETVKNALNKEVGDCLVKVIKGTSFDKPKGGGNVVVTYPFIFRAAP